MRQLWEYSVEELAERCAIAENEIERLRAALQSVCATCAYSDETTMQMRPEQRYAWKNQPVATLPDWLQVKSGYAPGDTLEVIVRLQPGDVIEIVRAAAGGNDGRKE